MLVKRLAYKDKVYESTLLLGTADRTQAAVVALRRGMVEQRVLRAVAHRRRVHSTS